MEKLFEERIVSQQRDLLLRMVNRKITRMVRHSWWPAEEALSQIGGADSRLLFSLTAGPLTIELDSGLILGFGSRPSEASVSVWLERDETGRERPSEHSTLRDPELHPIDVMESRFSEPQLANCVGREIQSVKLLRLRTTSALLEYLARHVGVVIQCDQGGSIILSHGLHDGSDDFSVLLPQRIAPDLVKDLEELDV